MPHRGGTATGSPSGAFGGLPNCAPGLRQQTHAGTDLPSDALTPLVRACTIWYRSRSVLGAARYMLFAAASGDGHLGTGVPQQRTVCTTRLATIRKSWSTYATDTAPLARSATAPLSQEQGIQAQPNRPVTAPRSRGTFFRSSDSRPYAGERASRLRRVLAHTRRQGDNDGMARDDSKAPSPLRWTLMLLLDGGRPSRTLGWVSPVAPVVTQAAAGAGHWAAGRRQRALAEWAGAAASGWWRGALARKRRPGPRC